MSTYRKQEDNETYYLSNNKSITPNFSIYTCCRLNLITFFCILAIIFLFTVTFTLVAILDKNEPDRDVMEEITIDGALRHFILHLPKNYNSSIAYPLLVAIHPFFTDVRQFKRKDGWDAASDSHQFIVLYPIAYSRNKRIDYVPWNTELIVSEAFLDKINDSYFIRKLIEVITYKYKVLTNRIFCAGHSDGGNMCYKTAGEYSNVFEGIAPISSSVGGQIGDGYPLVVYRNPIYPVKLVHVHGVKDLIVKIAGGTEEAPWMIKRVFLPLQRALDAYIAANGCTTNFEKEESKNNRIELRKYNCRTSQNIQLYFIREAGHWWLDLDDEVEYEKFKGKNLPEVIWYLLNDIPSVQ